MVYYNGVPLALPLVLQFQSSMGEYKNCMGVACHRVSMLTSPRYNNPEKEMEKLKKSKRKNHCSFPLGVSFYPWTTSPKATTGAPKPCC